LTSPTTVTDTRPNALPLDLTVGYDPRPWKVFRIGTVRYNWPMSAHASQAFSIAHCADSEDLPNPIWRRDMLASGICSQRYQCVLLVSLTLRHKIIKYTIIATMLHTYELHAILLQKF